MPTISVTGRKTAAWLECRYNALSGSRDCSTRSIPSGLCTISGRCCCDSDVESGNSYDLLGLCRASVLPYVSAQLLNTTRVDIVWDVYQTDSLKGTTRQKRDKGVRRRVVPSAAITKNWKDFLRVDDNKTELFSFLSHQVTLLQTEGKAVYATDRHDVLCSMAQIDLTGLVPCSHEEADTRLFLHVADSIKKGYRKLLVRTVDTDVVMVAIATLKQNKA